jgi:hypothetical protein
MTSLFTSRCAAAVSIALFAGACASRPAATSTGDLLQLHRGWWAAVAASDTGYVRAHSSPELFATFSSGKSVGVGELTREAAPTGRPAPVLECDEEMVRYSGSASAVVTSTCSETQGQFSSTYRFLTVLTRSAEGWKVSVAQSTARQILTPRTKPTQPLADFAGAYRTPRGRTLDVTAGDDSLTLREPSGLELRLEPIGPDLFEANYVAPGGWITRYSFARDDRGAVASLNVLSPGVVSTFPRNRTEPQ